MNDLIQFDFNSHAVRYEVIEGQVWFLANDVCDILEYKNSRRTIALHCKERGVTKRYTPTSSGAQEMVYINEGNLYRLIARSKMPEAEKFEEKVFDEILPSIRKTGSYQSTANGFNPADAVRTANHSRCTTQPVDGGCRAVVVSFGDGCHFVRELQDDEYILSLTTLPAWLASNKVGELLENSANAQSLVGVAQVCMQRISQQLSEVKHGR